MPENVTGTTLLSMTHIPPPAEELRFLDTELRQLDARRAQLLARRAWLLHALHAVPAPQPPPYAGPRPRHPASRTCFSSSAASC